MAGKTSNVKPCKSKASGRLAKPGKANPVKPKKISISLNDGSTHNLLMSFIAWEYLDNKYGHPNEAIEALRNGSLSAFGDCIYAGILHEYEEGEEPSRRSFAELLPLEDQKAFEALSQALLEALGGDQEGDGQGNPEEPADLK